VPLIKIILSVSYTCVAITSLYQTEKPSLFKYDWAF
jgi:hypothetical protein